MNTEGIVTESISSKKTNTPCKFSDAYNRTLYSSTKKVIIFLQTPALVLPQSEVTG